MGKINFKDKHIRYGGYGALLTLLVIAITIVLNIIVTNLNIKVDTTSEKIYSLSQTTQELVSTMQDPVTIYVLEQTGKETGWLQEILLKYTKASDKIHVVYKDPVLYPTFASPYLSKSNENLTTLKDSTLIVENEVTHKFKILPPTEFIQSTGSTSGSEIMVESVVTNGIGYVLTHKEGGIYYTTGHHELDLSASFIACCDNANLSTHNLNLLSDEMPDPHTSVVVIHSPHSDFSKEEVDKLIGFMQAGGKAMVWMDADAPNLVTFNQFLNYYGVAHRQGIVVETNAQNMTSVYATYLLPNKGTHPILSAMPSHTGAIVLPNSSGFEKLGDARTTLAITPLLTTSETAFLRTDLSQSDSTKQPGDLDGPITLAYAIEDSATGTQTASGTLEPTKLVVLGDSYCLSDQINVAATGNERLISSCLGWLLTIDTHYAIEGKAADTYALRTLSTAAILLTELLLVLIIPLIVMLTGIYVWIRRRHA